jgi:hypothetical protein
MFLALQRVFWWTLIGLAAVVLIGPVVAVVGTLLPFTLIGGLVWLGWRGVSRLAARLRGSPPRLEPVLQAVPEVVAGARQAVQDGLRKCKELAPAVGEQAKAVGRGAAEVLHKGVDHCRGAVPLVRERARQVRQGVAARGRVVMRVLTEVVSGGLAGTLIAWYAIGSEQAIIAGALAGVGLGVVTSGLGRRPAPEAEVAAKATPPAAV